MCGWTGILPSTLLTEPCRTVRCHVRDSGTASATSVGGLLACQRTAASMSDHLRLKLAESQARRILIIAGTSMTVRHAPELSSTNSCGERRVSGLKSEAHFSLVV